MKLLAFVGRYGRVGYEEAKRMPMSELKNLIEALRQLIEEERPEEGLTP